MSLNLKPVGEQQLSDCTSPRVLCSVTMRSWGRDFQLLPLGRNSLYGVGTGEILQAKRLFIDKCSSRQVETCGNVVVFSEKFWIVVRIFFFLKIYI